MHEPTPGPQIHARNYRFLQEHVYARAGIVVENGKHYLFENRLSPIVKRLGLESINDLCALLRATSEPEISQQVAEAMTTNETYFFRDPAQYAAIRNIALPRFKRDRADTRRLRFWSAAASTGQEAYSLAMVLLEEGFNDWNIQILGTDFSARVLERARTGQYQQLEVNRGLPAPLLVKYFGRTGTEWHLIDAVRSLVRFEIFDLRQSMRAKGPFDIVFCRNVLIYFDAETKKRILRELHGTLFRSGWLLLGGAETAFGIDEWFDRQTIEGATVYVAR